MARPIEYDQEEVLEGAMHAFWERGYAATSIRELVEATGLTTRSLYNRFGSKEGLFQAALQKYRAEHCERIYATLAEGRGREAIRAMFDGLLAERMPNGCFMVRTFAEQGQLEEPCLKDARAHFRKMERLLKAKLEEMREDGEFDGDSAATARMLMLVLQGASSFGQDDRNAKHLGDVVDGLLSAIGIE